MKPIKLELPLERDTPTSVWEQSEALALVTRPVADIHNDYHNQTDRWIRGGNNDLYKAHASLSPDRLNMYLFIEINAQLKTDAFYAALYLILDTKMFGSRTSRKLHISTIHDEVAILLAAE